MIRYFTTLIIGLLLCFVQARAQSNCTHTVKIQLKEIHNNRSIADAMIFVQEAKLNAQTDEDGAVVFENLCTGNYSIHIHGYDVQDTTVSLYINKTGTYKLLLPHAEHVLGQVEIHNINDGQLIQSREQLDSKTLRSNAGKTISEQLKNINGVTTLSNGATIAKPVIHGLHSNRILMLNNGIRQEDQQWGTEHAPNIDPYVANQVTVLKGAAGVRYGTDAIGGVVLVEPSPIRWENGWGGSVDAAMFSNNRMGVLSGMVEHRFEKMPSLAFRLQGTLKQGGNYQLPGGYWAANTGVREQNAVATINYHTAHAGMELYYSRFANTLGIYRGSHTGNQQDLENAINSDTPLVHADFSYKIDRPRQEVVHNLLKYKYHLDKGWGLWSFVYAFQNNYRQEYDVMRVDNGKAQLNLSLNTHTFNINLDHKKIGKWSGTVGVDGQYQHNTFKDGDRVFIPSYYSYAAALYAIERYSFGSYKLELGARYDYKHFEMYNPQGVTLTNVLYLFDYSNPSATVALKKQINKSWDASLTLANAWRAPQASELFSAGFHQGAARIEMGNKTLKPEQSYSLNLSSNYAVNEKLAIEATAYLQRIQHFIYLKPGADLLTIRGYYKTFDYTQTNALLKGIDLAASYHWNKHWQSTAKVSMLRATDLVQKDWLILMPSDRYKLSTRYERDINKHFKECFVGLAGQWVNQQKRIPANFDSIDYPRPPAAYFLLDAEAGVQLHIRQQPIYCSITASNLLNAKYRDYLDVFRYFLDQPGTNIALRFNVPIN